MLIIFTSLAIGSNEAIISIGNHTHSSPIRDSEIIVLAIVKLDEVKPSLILTIACTSMFLIGSMSFLLLV